MDSTTVANGDERIVKVLEIVEGEETVFYAIRDVNLDYWLGDDSLNDDQTKPVVWNREEFDSWADPEDDEGPSYMWTKDRKKRAEFSTYSDAYEVLKSLWHFRASQGKTACS